MTIKGWWAAGLCLAAVGCLPAPGPRDNTAGKLEIGANYTATQTGRWACPGADFVLASDKKGVLLHDLSEDFVARKPTKSETGQVFTAGNAILQRSYDVPNDPAQPAKLKEWRSLGGADVSMMSRSGAGLTQTDTTVVAGANVTEHTCAPAPAVTLW